MRKVTFQYCLWKAKTNPRRCEVTEESLWIHSLKNSIEAENVFRNREILQLKKNLDHDRQGIKMKDKKGIVNLKDYCQKYKDDIAIVASLKACADKKDLLRGSRIHSDVLHKNLHQRNIFIGNSLINMYVKCGCLEHARRVFDVIHIRDVVSWTSLITGYVQDGYTAEALNCFGRMQCEGLLPNEVTYLCLLKSCGTSAEVKKGTQTHVFILRDGLLEKKISLVTALMDMYSKCGLISNVVEVFEKLQTPSIVSWNAIIAAYAHHGSAKEALNHFEQMKCEGFSPDAFSFACILKTIGMLRLVSKGKEVHAEITSYGLLGTDCVLDTALVDMYIKCGFLAKAQQVLDELPVRGVVTWNALIAGYIQHGKVEEALTCFERMQQEETSPNVVTFICVLKACGKLGTIEKGEEIHSQITREGLLGNNPSLDNALVDMYAKCGSFSKAEKVFRENVTKDVTSWNVLIAGYVQHGHINKALACFDQMQVEGRPADAVTLTCILKACGSIGALEKGKEVHKEIIRSKLLHKNRLLGNALVDMYAKCGSLLKAQEVFDELPLKDKTSWNALITGYGQQEHIEDVLACFEKMRLEGHSPDVVTFICVLKACGSIGACKKGEDIHSMIVREGFLKKDYVLGIALVDMYARCGELERAQKVFDEVAVRNVVSWTALIAGYAQTGKHQIVFRSFNKMIGERVLPDVVTFTVVLKTCSSLDLMNDGELYFEIMTRRFGIVPSFEHYTCMVSLFSRAGNFEMAVKAMKNMPSANHLPSWYTLLGACRKWGNMAIGRMAFERAVQLDEMSAVAYVNMSHIYAIANKQDEKGKLWI